jgi:hypothetical protein
MRRACFCICLSIFGLSVVSASAAASTIHGTRYSEVTRGVVLSTVEDVTSTTGTVTGTLIAHGTSSGSQMASAAVPSCSLGLGGPISGSTITVANRGANLYTSFTGTVCESTSTSTAATYEVKAAFTITGGTGRFSNATGGGTFKSKATLRATPQGSQGPVTTRSRGVIFLEH